MAVCVYLPEFIDICHYSDQKRKRKLETSFSKSAEVDLAESVGSPPPPAGIGFT